jgi:hypothetical protein
VKSLRKLAARALYKTAMVVDSQQQVKLVGDEYLDWLSYANSGMLAPGNRYLIEYAIKHLPSAAPILEIGSFCGLSTNVITHFKRKHGKGNSLITSDKWQFENVNNRTEIPNSPILFSDYKKFVRDSYIRNIKMFSPDDLPYTLELTSDELYEAWRKRSVCTDVLGRSLELGGSLSFCYIDGNHTYEFAKRDFQNCDGFLDAGGFILFDDSTIEHFGVHKLMPEIVSTGKYELVGTNPFHLFRKKNSR